MEGEECNIENFSRKRDSIHYSPYFCKTGVCLTVLSAEDCGSGNQLTAFEHYRGAFCYAPRIPGSCITCTWYPATLFRETLGSTNLFPSGLPFLGYSPRQYPIQLSGRVLKDPLQRQDQHEY